MIEEKETKQETEEKVKESASAEAKTDKKEKEVEIPKKFKKLVEEIEKMSVLDLAELVKILEKKFGVSSAPMVMAPAAAGAPGAAPAIGEGKKFVNISLTGVGEKKIEVIKVVRDVTKRGLKEAKDLVDAVVSGPQVVQENVKNEEAEEIKKKFETAGATVELK